MRPQWIRQLFIFSLFFLSTVAPADLPSIIEKIKPSIVAIGTYKKTNSPPFSFRGTGFVVGNGTRIATNAHVIQNAESEGTLIAILTKNSSGEAQVREARILSKDSAHDLAVLSIEGPPMQPLRLSDESSIREGDRIAFTGFPIGNALGFSPVTHQGMISAITPIALPGNNTQQLNAKLINQLKRGTFDIYQLDATAYPGNSGSPVYNPETGAVVGIINMVFIKGSKEAALTNPSGITYAIPVRFLANLVK
ncbi:MAG: serine protease [Azonexus sp.]|nr:serine protease [Azonexus sp.]